MERNRGEEKNASPAGGRYRAACRLMPTEMNHEEGLSVLAGGKDRGMVRKSMRNGDGFILGVGRKRRHVKRGALPDEATSIS